MLSEFEMTQIRATLEAHQSMAKSLELIATRLDKPTPPKQFDDAELAELYVAVRYYCDDGVPLEEGRPMLALEKKLEAMTAKEKEAG